jgi:hypothetical protein
MVSWSGHREYTIGALLVIRFEENMDSGMMRPPLAHARALRRSLVESPWQTYFGV